MQPYPPRLPSLVFLHYFGGSSRAWDGVSKRLGAAHDCIAPDLRGFGSASAARGPFTVDAYADDIAELVAERGLDRFVVVGHSMGGKVALALAARQPAGLVSLVLVAPSPPTPEPMSEEARAETLAAYGDREAARATARRITRRPLAQDLVEGIVDDMLRTGEPAWKAWLQEGSRENLSARLRCLPVPTLVIAGGGDPVIPKDILESKVMPFLAEGRLVTIAKAGHLLPLEAPDEVADLIDTVARAPQPASSLGVLP